MSGSLKIAVADDELDTREYLERYLTHLGHDVRAAADGRALVDLCRDFAPDLVVTDFAMPGLTGLAAAAQVNHDRPVPVILITGRDDVESDAATAAHVIAFLVKPVSPADLKAAVESVAATCPSRS
jgi:CheY-like chemotaxis protein